METKGIPGGENAPVQTVKPEETPNPTPEPTPEVTPAPTPEPTPEPTIEPTIAPSPEPVAAPVVDETPQRGTAPESTEVKYIGNKNTGKFHYPSCKSVKQMKDKNKAYLTCSRDEAIAMGYVPCKNCNP